MDSRSAIGVFDSGLGGISVLETIHEIMPNEDLIYLGDSKYNPYGTKTKEQITQRCISICDEFKNRDVKAIVIACNTATSACVDLLRKRYDLDIVGMEPALKVACDLGNHQRIAVWATELTLNEKKFARLMDRFKQEHEIIKVACPKLVRIVEQDQLDDECVVNAALEEYIDSSHIESLDSIVLGCTHFPFFKDQLSKLIPNVRFIDGSVGTTLHLKSLLETKDLLNDAKHIGRITWLNTDETKIELSKRLFNRLEK